MEYTSRPMMDEDCAVMLYHMLQIDEHFIEELHFRRFIMDDEASQLRKLSGKNRLDQLFSLLQRSRMKRKKELFDDMLEDLKRGFAKPYIGCMLTGEPEEQRNLLLKIQKKRTKLKAEVKDPVVIAKRLHSDEYLERKDVQDVCCKHNLEDQTDALISAVINKGHCTVKAFLRELAKNHESLATEIETLIVDGAGKILKKDKIKMSLWQMTRATNQELQLEEVPKEYCTIYKNIFAGGAALSEKYQVVYCSIKKTPFMLSLQKLPGYSHQPFLHDLLNRDVAKIFTAKTPSNPQFVIDVNISQLEENASSGYTPDENSSDESESDGDSMSEYSIESFEYSSGADTSDNGGSSDDSDDGDDAPGDHNDVPGDDTIVPGDHNVTPGDHSVVAADHNVIPGDHSVSENPSGESDSDGDNMSEYSIESFEYSSGADTSDNGGSGDDGDDATGDHNDVPGDHNVAPGDHNVISGDHNIAENPSEESDSDGDSMSDYSIESFEYSSGTDTSDAPGDHNDVPADHIVVLDDHNEGDYDELVNLHPEFRAADELVNLHPEFQAADGLPSTGFIIEEDERE